MASARRAQNHPRIKYNRIYFMLCCGIVEEGTGREVYLFIFYGAEDFHPPVIHHSSLVTKKLFSDGRDFFRREVSSM
jgi:hypothetical protein